MKLPYNHLHICGDVLFGARGGRIYSFSLSDGAVLSQWQHPDLEKVAQAAVSEPELQPGPAAEESRPDDAERPAKRQRRESAAGDAPEQEQDVPMTEAVDQAPSQDGGQKKNEKKKKKKKDREDKKPKREAIASVPDRPVVIHMASTTDGSHLLAVSGHDKTIWVFSHDGKGGLTQLSKRTMPKRPSSVLICPDNAMILSADKFGDVYSLPLLPSATPASAPPPISAAAIRAKSKYPAATALTVHSQANLRSLENQLRSLEASAKRKQAEDPDKGTPPGEVPAFEHTLQLGHVSMLTALALARDGQGRRYILTADRDEHIRVSRFMPQAHVIEGYCLGHEHFVSVLAIPPARPDVLVSGGGDSDFFVWSWLEGRILDKVDVLGRVREVVGDNIGHVAVVALLAVTCPQSEDNGAAESHVLAICEDAPFLFHWKLVNNALPYVESVRLPGNPLHITAQTSGDSTDRILASIDADGPSGHEPTAASSAQVIALHWQGTNLVVDPSFLLQDATLDAEEPDVSAVEVRQLFYNTASLRKYTGGQTEEGEEVVGAGEGDAVPDVPVA